MSVGYLRFEDEQDKSEMLFEHLVSYRAETAGGFSSVHCC